MASVSYAMAEEALRERLSPGALAHSQRVAHAAAELAGVYDVDVDEARLAGLLHDWHRDLDDDSLLVQAEALGVRVSDVDIAIPYLLHARTGSASLASAFPALPRSVLDAVERHTVGASDMTDLDRVVYLADMLEPGRKHAPLDGLRDDIGKVPLTELFERAYAASLQHLVERRRLIHPDTVAVWNSLARAGRR